MEKDSERKDVVALREKGEVWIGEDRVAKWNGGEMKLRGEALAVKNRIDELMTSKRLPIDSLSE
eukprot:3207817-Karenia_brevis.AAC.1